MVDSKNKRINIADLKSIGVQILTKYGTARSIAEVVIMDLIRSDVNGYKSHGIMRLPEYINQVQEQIIVADNSPAINYHFKNSFTINGERRFGAVVKQYLIQQLLNGLKSEPIMIGGIVNSNHIGRLESIGTEIASAGYIVLGFVNYMGAGQHVPPWGGAEGRFCTNPMLLAFPSVTKNVVIDMTTSIVSEGEIRNHYLNKKEVPSGYLINANWENVKDPTHFYSNPQTAFIPPLGDKKGYKGYALGLAVEILAGIITGAGYSKNTPSIGGNGGFFIAFNSSVLGLQEKSVLESTEELLQYIKSADVSSGFDSIKIPGENINNNIDETQDLYLEQEIWQSILELR